MKIISTLMIAALLLSCTNSNAQQDYEQDEITAETFIRMNNHEGGPFAMSPLIIQNAPVGFIVKWQTINETNIESFDLQISVDKKDFTSVKKMAASNSVQPNNIYEINLSNNLIQRKKTYFRVKTTYSNGTAVCSNIAVVASATTTADTRSAVVNNP